MSEDMTEDNKKGTWNDRGEEDPKPPQLVLKFNDPARSDSRMVRLAARQPEKGIGHIDTKETEAVFRADFWALRHDFISKRTPPPAGIGESPLFRHMEPSADVPAW